MSRRSVYDWQRAVYASSISPNVRLLLIYLSEHMREHDKHVSVPRKKIATALGWSETVVSTRLREAVEHDFLRHVSAGHKGRTAIYAGLFPDHTSAVSVRKNRTLTRDQKHGRFAPSKRPQFTDTSSRAEPTTGGDDRDVSQDEKPGGTAARFSATACDEHGWCEDHRCLTAGSRTA